MCVQSKAYQVERILRRKIGHKKDKAGIYYLLKWLNYDDSHNSWEPETNLNCDVLLDDFIIGKGHHIVDAKRTPFGIDYWMKFSDGFANQTFSSIEARAKWPQLVIQYLESRIVMVREVQFNARLNFSDGSPPPAVVEAENMIGDPIEITCKANNFFNLYLSCSLIYLFFFVSDATNVGAEVMYWAEWLFQRKKFVPSSQAKENWPNLVLNYLESKLET